MSNMQSTTHTTQTVADTFRSNFDEETGNGDAGATVASDASVADTIDATTSSNAGGGTRNTKSREGKKEKEEEEAETKSETISQSNQTLHSNQTSIRSRRSSTNTSVVTHPPRTNRSLKRTLIPMAAIMMMLLTYFFIRWRANKLETTISPPVQNDGYGGSLEDTAAPDFRPVYLNPDDDAIISPNDMSDYDGDDTDSDNAIITTTPSSPPTILMSILAPPPSLPISTTATEPSESEPTMATTASSSSLTTTSSSPSPSTIMKSNEPAEPTITSPITSSNSPSTMESSPGDGMIPTTFLSSLSEFLVPKSPTTSSPTSSSPPSSTTQAITSQGASPSNKPTTAVLQQEQQPVKPPVPLPSSMQPTAAELSRQPTIKPTISPTQPNPTQEPTSSPSLKPTALTYISVTNVNLATLKGSGIKISSSSSALQPSINAFDDNTDTRWESYPNSDNEWLAIDLGAVYQLSRVIINWEYASAKSYDIQVSIDGISYVTLWSKLDGYEGMIGSVESRLGGEFGRFVRMQAYERTTIWGYSIWEMAVFGRGPIESVGIDPGVDIARGKVSYSSSESQPSGDAFDGNPDTRWQSNPGTDNEYLEIDLGGVYQLSRVTIDWEYASAISYDIQVSTDGISYITLWGKNDGSSGMGSVDSLLGGQFGRYVRMQGRKRATDWGYSIWEMEVFAGAGSSVSGDNDAEEVDNESGGSLLEEDIDEWFIEDNGTPQPTRSPTPKQPFFFGDEFVTYENLGLEVSRGLSVRLIAKTGEPVQYANNGGESKLDYHTKSDGAGIISMDPTNPLESGYVYVANSEVGDGEGGVYGLYFDKDGNIINYKALLTKTTDNCGGGLTPWHTWVSCEEYEDGQCWQVDPINERAEETVLGGSGGRYESVAVDNRNPDRPVFFTTEDHERGAMRRFLANGNGWDALHTNGETTFLNIIDGNTFEWTTNENDARDSAENYYRNSEGIQFHDGKLYFMAKTDLKMLILDLENMTYVTETTGKKFYGEGSFENQPDQNMFGPTRKYIYFTEDGGDSPGVYARYGDDGTYFTMFEAIEGGVYAGDETVGIALSPDHKRFYAGIQDEGVIFEFTRDDGLPFE